jgi:hypothetical protein
MTYRAATTADCFILSALAIKQICRSVMIANFYFFGHFDS